MSNENSANYLQVQLLKDDAKVPVRAHKTDVGYDLFASENRIIENNQRQLISTGIAVKIPDGYYGRVAPRSGLSTKGIDIGAGVIDPGYTGELKVLMINNEKTWHTVYKGDKIAQLILEKVSTPEIKVVNNLDNSDRGDKGFGSTGY
jgi:dUTP pyrophosphatase